MSKAAELQASPRLQRGDAAYLSPVHAAQLVEPAHGANAVLYLMLALVVCALTWACIVKVDMVTRAEARVVPDGREQVISSLEGGILRELRVREGDQVAAGQELALLDPTRFESMQNEGRAKRVALLGAIARLQSEALGRPLAFPSEVLGARAVVQGETESYQARARALNEAVEINRRSQRLLERELGVAEAMSAKGLMSEVEVMRVRRQVNDMQQATQERVNRFRQDASAELVRARTELSMLDVQLAGRDDVLRRTVLTSPVRGLVKSIRANTIGGVVAPGAAIIEIVPIGERVLIEAKVKPADIGFIKVGQRVEIKLSAYETTVYGTLRGHVQAISPDAMGDPDRPGDATWYRTTVLADRSTLKAGGKPLAVIPGMTGSAEINTGERTVLSFLLRPMLKAREAFRER
jgi:membrane fusion protein, adhesin transport system